MTNPEARILGTLTGTCVVGIDVAKAWLDVAVRPAGPSETPWRVANSNEPLQHRNDAGGEPADCNFQRETFARELIHHGEQPEFRSRQARIMDEIIQP